MNHKQKVINNCREYSSMALKSGTVVKFSNHGAPMILNHLKCRADGKHDLYASSLRDGEPLEMTGLATKDVEELVIIGVEPTLSQLLQALGETDKFGTYTTLHLNKGFLVVGEPSDDELFEDYFLKEDTIKIPTNHHTLADIPESDPCWVALTKLLNLD